MGPLFIATQKELLWRGVMEIETDGASSTVPLPSNGLASEDELSFELVGDRNLLGSRASRRDDSALDTRGAELSDVSLDVDSAVRSAWNSLPQTTLKPIWETGFWNTIFGNSVVGDQLTQTFNRPVEPPPVFADLEQSVEAQKRRRAFESFSSSIPFSQSCVQHCDDVTWQECRSMLLQRALKHWAVMIEGWGPSVHFVQMLVECDSINSQIIMLGDVFKNKAPSTLMKRANSLKKLCCYLGELGLYFPCSETFLYKYLCELRDLGLPASRGKGVLEAVAFVRYTMGIEECAEMLKGRRCWGAASSDAVKEKSQASPLTVKELQVLHAVLQNDHDLWNQAFAGMVLFVAYSRARWTDAQQASAILFDRDDSGNVVFVEAATGVHKTIHALQHRHQFLPLVAPALGVCSDNWAEKWEQVRNQLGMQLGPGCPLLPAPMEDGSIGKRMLSSQECGKWLRALISRQLVIDDYRKLSSRSLKCTTLSMLAKRGVSMEDRLILEYHTSPFKVGLT